MTPETYNGWTNRETWCVALWLNNEQALQEVASDACSQPGEMLQEAAQSLEDYVDELLEDDSPSGCSGFARDLINCALSRVNWGEIAVALREG